MNENDELNGSSPVEDSTPSATPKKKTKKKAAKKAAKKTKKKKTGSTAPRGRKLYSLRASVKVDEFNPKTHAGAVVHALDKIEEGTSADIVAQVTKDKKIVVGMKTGIKGAVQFVLWELSHKRDVLKTREKTKTEKAAA
jgi:hypothetical protein